MRHYAAVPKTRLLLLQRGLTCNTMLSAHRACHSHIGVRAQLRDLSTWHCLCMCVHRGLRCLHVQTVARTCIQTVACTCIQTVARTCIQTVARTCMQTALNALRTVRYRVSHAAMRFAHGVASTVDILLAGSTHPDPAVHGLTTVRSALAADADGGGAATAFQADARVAGDGPSGRDAGAAAARTVVLSGVEVLLPGLGV